MFVGYMVNQSKLGGFEVSRRLGKAQTYINKAAFAPNMAAMAAARALDAASDGVITTISASLIAEVFLDEKRRSQAMGWRQAVSSLLGIGAGVASGVLALGNWRHAFYLNAFGIVCIILAVGYVPMTPPEGQRSQSGVLAALKENPASTRMILVELVLFALSQIVFYQAIYLLGGIVEELGLGTSALTGVLTSVINIALVGACVLFSPIYLRTRERLVAPMFVVMGAAMAAMHFSANPFVFGALILVSGFASGILYPYYSMVIAEVAPEELMSFWMGLYTVVTYAVASASGYLPGLVTQLTGITGISPTFMVSGGALVVVGIIEAVRHRASYLGKND